MLMANYNNFIFDYVNTNGIVNPFTGSRDYNIRNMDFLAFYGGLRNGDSPDQIYSLYGGPGSQTVMNQFASDQRSLWHQYLAHNGYIIVSVDNRGTGARGATFKKQIYKNMGKVETEDQIAVAKYLAKKSFVDSTRIGIWGWSYGGFMTMAAMTFEPEEFKVGVNIYGVTNWIRTLRSIPAFWEATRKSL